MHSIFVCFDYTKSNDSSIETKYQNSIDTFLVKFKFVFDLLRVDLDCVKEN